MGADIVIRGGTVVDGSGAPGRRADVAITGDTISAIGENLSGARTIDASGHVVAPGFIDIHTHFDAQVFWDPALTPSSNVTMAEVVASAPVSSRSLICDETCCTLRRWSHNT